MRWLEARVPPPVVALTLAVAMGWAAPTLGSADRGPLQWALSVPLAVLGAGLGLAGSRAFRKVGTTVNPLRPEKASTLVADGVYRVTRNPMYLGMALALAGWAAWIAAPWAIAGPVLFVAWITRFQIPPEEAALQARFGTAYADYRRRVRRWL